MTAMWKCRAGWLVWFSAVSALAFFENNAGTRLVWLGSLLIPSLSVLCAMLAARSTKVTLTLPDECTKGTAVEGGCTVCGKGTLAGACTECALAANNALTGEATRLHVLPKGLRRKVGAFTLSVSHCGTVRLCVEEAWVTDWFGLARFRLKQSDVRELKVFPELYPVQVALTQPAIHSAARALTLSAFAAPAGEEACEVRAYSAGDPIRRIHWKLSEKLDRTMVRNAQRQEGNEVLLLLETSLREGFDADAIDKTVEALLAVSHGLTISHINHRVGWYNGNVECRLVTSEDDFEALQRQILCTASVMGEDGIGALFGREHGDETFEHIGLFSPSPETNAVSLAEQGRVTLILPESRRPVDGMAEVYITSVSREANELSI